MALKDLGMNATLHYGAVDAAIGSLTEYAKVTEVAIDLTNDLAETTTRDNNGFKSQQPTLGDCKITFKAFSTPVDADLQTFIDAFVAKTGIEIAALSGPLLTVGSQGPLGTFIVSSMPRAEGLGDVVSYTVELTLQSWKEWHEVTV